MSKEAKKVAKIIVIDETGSYLLLRRSDHPAFGNDPDLPGGTLEEGESTLETMVREVEEEAGLKIDASRVQEIYSGTDYSEHGTHYVLYVTNLDARPEVVLSWEHASFEWLPRDKFIEQLRHTKDTYMHMAGDVVAALDEV